MAQAIATNIATNIAEKVLGKLGSLAYQEICLAWGLESDFNKLEKTLSTIKAVILDAEEKQAKNREISDWLEKLKDVCYDADDVLDEFEYEDLSQQVMSRGDIKTKVRNCSLCSNRLLFRFKMGHKIKEINEKLDEIAAEKANLHLTERVESTRVVRIERESHSYVQVSDVIGRDSDKEKIVQLLMLASDYENVSVISIVGLGGLGKTTLAKLVYNDERVIRHFELKKWVCVLDDFGVKRLIKEIINSETSINCGDLTIDQLQIRLQRTLRGKLFLLVLDDVWNDDYGKWNNLKSLLTVCANGSKIIVTTRMQSVASIMSTVPPHTHMLEDLSHEDCLSLFVKWAFKKGEEKQYPHLMKIGKEIVKKCKGVPLAVTTLGGLLHSKTDERDWIFVRENEIWKLEQRETDILPVLRLSYDSMPAFLKQCFAFCSVFPKDYKFDSVELIQCWMAQDLLQSCNENQELEEIGQQYVNELCTRSFFQDIEDNFFFSNFKMHDLVHDLAVLVAQTETFIVNHSAHFIPKRVRHLSFSEDDSSWGLVSKFIPKPNKLRTIRLPSNFSIPATLIGEFTLETCISRLKSVRVLDLRGVDLGELPSSIGNLKHLRYLALSSFDTFITPIKKLPNSISKLYNLQSLILLDEFEELPRDIGNLISLRRLTFRTKQTYLPEGIGRLTSLRLLSIGCVNLKSLGEGMHRLTSIRALVISSCENLEDSLPRILKQLNALETLCIDNCAKLNMMGWEEDNDIRGVKLSLRSLWIESLPQLEALPNWLQGAANTLHYLHIKWCNNLTTLPEWLQNFTSLQKLEIQHCSRMLTLPEEMPCLTTLRQLEIVGYRELIRRCEQPMREDWPAISHIPSCPCCIIL